MLQGAMLACRSTTHWFMNQQSSSIRGSLSKLCLRQQQISIKKMGNDGLGSVNAVPPVSECVWAQ